MKCPKCNRELKEGQLYCEVCGEEIQMVPEFEPEIENIKVMVWGKNMNPLVEAQECVIKTTQ